MLEKSRKRGERRWRSFHAWMRRLQDDWWEHGTRIDPRSVYREWKENNGACSLRSTDRWTDRFYCPCFDLKDNGAYHFKNAPTGNKSRRRFRLDDWDSRGLRHSDKKKLPVERESHGNDRSRRNRGGLFRERVQCRCGYFLGWEWVKHRSYWGRGYACPDCKRKAKEQKMIKEVA